MKSKFSIVAAFLIVAPLHSETKESSSFKFKFNLEIEIPQEVYVSNPAIVETANNLMRMLANSPELKAAAAASAKPADPAKAVPVEAEPALKMLAEPETLVAGSDSPAILAHQVGVPTMAAYELSLRDCAEDYHAWARYQGADNTLLHNITKAHSLSLCKRIVENTEEVVVYNDGWEQCERLNLVFTDAQLSELRLKR